MIRFVDNLLNLMRKESIKVDSQKELVSYINSKNLMKELERVASNVEIAITKVYSILIHPNAEY